MAIPIRITQQHRRLPRLMPSLLKKLMRRQNPVIGLHMQRMIERHILQPHFTEMFSPHRHPAR